MNFSIQLIDHAEIEIAAAIHSVFQVSYQVEADLVGSDNFPPLQRSIQNIANSQTDFYGFYIDKILAAVMELERSSNHFHICSLVVDPAYFRQGIGRKLITYAFDTHNPISATVETAAVNEPAIALYKKLGFEKDCIYMTDVGIPKIKLKYNC